MAYEEEFDYEKSMQPMIQQILQGLMANLNTRKSWESPSGGMSGFGPRDQIDPEIASQILGIYSGLSNQKQAANKLLSDEKIANIEAQTRAEASKYATDVGSETSKYKVDKDFEMADLFNKIRQRAGITSAIGQEKDKEMQGVLGYFSLINQMMEQTPPNSPEFKELSDKRKKTLELIGKLTGVDKDKGDSMQQDMTSGSYGDGSESGSGEPGSGFNAKNHLLKTLAMLTGVSDFTNMFDDTVDKMRSRY